MERNERGFHIVSDDDVVQAKYEEDLEQFKQRNSLNQLEYLHYLIWRQGSDIADEIAALISEQQEQGKELDRQGLAISEIFDLARDLQAEVERQESRMDDIEAKEEAR